MRRLPWWAVGLVAGVLAYLALLVGFLLADAATDPSCGMLGGEVIVAFAALLFHSWFGFVTAVGLARPGNGIRVYVLSVAVSIVSTALDFAALGPPVYGSGRCDSEPPRVLAGILVTAVAAALAARRLRSTESG